MKAVAEVKYLIAALARKIAGSEIYYHPVNVCIALNGLQGVCVLTCQILCGSVVWLVVVGWREEKCSVLMYFRFMHDLSLCLLSHSSFPSFFLACSSCSFISRQILELFCFQFANRKKKRNALMLHHLNTFYHTHSWINLNTYTYTYVLTAGMDDSSVEVRDLLSALMDKSISAEEQGIDKAGDREISMALFGMMKNILCFFSSFVLCLC